MARFKHRVTGSVVSVADEKADRFLPEWERIDGSGEAEAKPTTRRKKQES